MLIEFSIVNTVDVSRHVNNHLLVWISALKGYSELLYVIYS